jgi:hypothetical protein
MALALLLSSCLKKPLYKVSFEVEKDIKVLRP